jgi:hypothetical protein
LGLCLVAVLHKLQKLDIHSKETKHTTHEKAAFRRISLSISSGVKCRSRNYMGNISRLQGSWLLGLTGGGCTHPPKVPVNLDWTPFPVSVTTFFGTFVYKRTISSHYAGHRNRVVKGINCLRCDRGFESRLGHGCLLFVLCVRFSVFLYR